MENSNQKSQEKAIRKEHKKPYLAINHQKPELMPIKGYPQHNRHSKRYPRD